MRPTSGFVGFRMPWLCRGSSHPHTQALSNNAPQFRSRSTPQHLPRAGSPHPGVVVRVKASRHRHGCLQEAHFPTFHRWHQSRWIATSNAEAFVRCHNHPWRQQQHLHGRAVFEQLQHRPRIRGNIECDELHQQLISTSSSRCVHLPKRGALVLGSCPFSMGWNCFQCA